MTLSTRGILSGIPWLWLSLPAAAQLPPGFSSEGVLAELAYPTGVSFLPDGRLLTRLKAGEVLVSDSAPGAAPAAYLTIADVDDYGERGLIDLALDPGFPVEPYVYAFYSHGPSERHRVSRFTHLGAVADPASELVLWQSSHPWTSCCHVGGAIDFGTDGHLFIATGDGFSTSQPQDLARSGGKLLRIARDGSIPADNPFAGTPGALPEVWALGLRNPYRARFDDATGRLFVGEVGSNDHQAAIEDVVVGEAGANYGWPFCEGPCGDLAYVDPIHSYPHAGEKACVVGGFVYRGSSFPAPWGGRYFYGDHSRGWIRALELGPGPGLQPTVIADVPFASDLGELVALEEGPEGELYYVVYDEPGATLGSVARIVHAGGPGGNGGGGSTMAGVAGAASDRGAADRTGGSGSPPVVAISRPEEGQRFRVAEALPVAARAADPDGDLPPSAFSWHVVALTEAGELAVAGPLHGRRFDLDLSSLEPRLPWRALSIELRLSVTDASGLVATDSVRIEPELAGGSELPAPAPAAGRCLELDGLDDWVSVPRIELAGDFTIEAWVRLAEPITNRDGIVHNVTEVGGRRDINFYLGRPRMWVGTNVVVASREVLPDRWTHVAVTREGSALTLYLEGLPDATGAWDGTFVFDALGRANAGRTEGRLDEVRIWSVARSAAEILADHDRRVAGDAGGLLAAWSFEEPVAEQEVRDRTGSGHDGVLGSSASPAGDDPRRVPSGAPLRRGP